MPANERTKPRKIYGVFTDRGNVIFNDRGSAIDIFNDRGSAIDIFNDRDSGIDIFIRTHVVLHQHTPDTEVERESEIAVAPVSLVGISSAGEKIIKVIIIW